ncbi:pseudouridine synthase [Lyticum sinuosum]|uniref:Ribosomal large subunit pseudouridine synthase C n=1 Tax=Lyticum sinuosum TaxID=1332059 RepID=A0AAE4VLB2_9RICK|nr:pseudouridine synthase [Lyticum sinuosum]MDZ5761534.1 Ribosomal large subunit pseudouridine synthase C [Lyticum sinuosum]
MGNYNSSNDYGNKENENRRREFVPYKGDFKSRRGPHDGNKRVSDRRDGGFNGRRDTFERRKRNFDSPPPEIKKYMVSSEHSGMNIMKFCQANFANVPEERIKHFLERGSLRVNNERANIENTLKPGQEVSFPETMFKDDPRLSSPRTFERRYDRGGSDRGGNDRRDENRSDGNRFDSRSRDQYNNRERRYNDRPGGGGSRYSTPNSNDRPGGGSRYSTSNDRPGGGSRYSTERSNSNDRSRFRSNNRENSYQNDSLTKEERRAKRREHLEYSPKYQILCQNIKTWAIYNDDSFVVLNKPAGIPVQGGTNVDISIDDLIWVFNKDASLVHRIDSSTSGLLIIALNLEAATELGYMFKERKIDKKYCGLVTGVFHDKNGIIDFPIGKYERDRDRGGEQKDAITNYKVVSENENFSLVHYNIVTGRTHQIRIHTAMKGCPILGDRKYSSGAFIDLDLNVEQQKAQSEASWMHLHAQSMSFKLFGKSHEIEAPLPEYFTKSVEIYNLK